MPSNSVNFTRRKHNSSAQNVATHIGHWIPSIPTILRRSFDRELDYLLDYNYGTGKTPSIRDGKPGHLERQNCEADHQSCWPADFCRRPYRWRSTASMERQRVSHGVALRRERDLPRRTPWISSNTQRPKGDTHSRWSKNL